MDKGSKTILLVEDDTIVAMLERLWLVKEGFSVICVSSGEGAINTVMSRSGEIDLILMDIDLGNGMNGIEAAREILASYDIPLLFLSSHTEPELVRKTEEISSYGYVVKGSSETVLLASIKMAFKLYKAKMELKEKAAIIQQEKLKTENYVNVVEVMLLGLDTEGKITMINRKGCQLLGYREDELIGKMWYFCIPKSELERLTGYFYQLIGGGLDALEYHENEIITKSGERRLIAWHNSLLKDEYGRITGTLSSGEDITEKRSAENLLKESENNFRQLITNMGEGIGFVDQYENFTFANRSGEEIFGVEPGKLIGRNLSEFCSTTEYQRICSETDLRQNGVKSVYECLITRDDGTQKTILVTATPRFSDNSEFIGSFGTFRDITERKQIENKLIESEHTLSEMAKNIPGIVYQYRVRENGSSYFGYLSETAAQTLGLTLETKNPEQVVVEQIAENDRRRFIDSIHAAVRTGSVWEFEGQFMCKCGSLNGFRQKHCLRLQEVN